MSNEDDDSTQQQRWLAAYVANLVRAGRLPPGHPHAASLESVLTIARNNFDLPELAAPRPPDLTPHQPEVSVALPDATPTPPPTPEYCGRSLSSAADPSLRPAAATDANASTYADAHRGWFPRGLTQSERRHWHVNQWYLRGDRPARLTH